MGVNLTAKRRPQWSQAYQRSFGGISTGVISCASGSPQKIHGGFGRTAVMAFRSEALTKKVVWMTESDTTGPIVPKTSRRRKRSATPREADSCAGRGMLRRV